MEARLLRLLAVLCALCSLGASYRTQHFLVTAPTPQLAQEIGQYAERYRRELAVEWLGRELPEWSGPCPIQAQVSPGLGAGGATSFAFVGGRPIDFTMTIQGSRERILDSVLPHEITHTVFATHFGRPLPRWADEGACTTVEHPAERRKQEQLLIQFLTTNRGIAFNRMFQMMDYPDDMLPLYSQGYALAQFFIAQGGKRKYVNYVGEGMQTNNWTATTRKYYGYDSLSDLQVTWLEWIRSGRQTPIPAAFAKAPELKAAANNHLAATNAIPTNPDANEAATSAGRDIETTGAALASEPPAPLTAVAVAESGGIRTERYAPGSTARVGLIERSATRPQPIGQPQQQVLQWERSAVPDARAPTGTLIR